MKEHNQVTHVNWTMLSNASMHPQPHCREMSITMCRVWDTIHVSQSKGELHLQMAASADKQATSNSGLSLPTSNPDSRPTCSHAFSDSRLGPGGIPSNRSSRPIFGPVPQKQTQPTNPLIQLPQKECMVWGATPKTAHTKNGCMLTSGSTWKSLRG